MSGSVLSDAGGFAQVRNKGEAPMPVSFPICLAIKFGNRMAEMCPSFMLNVDKSWVFVRTGSPLPVGALVMLHFYIPPAAKLLAEIRGKVIPSTVIDEQLSDGMLIRLAPFSSRKLKQLEHFWRGERPLVNRRA